MDNQISMLFQGLGKNLIITFLSAIIPLTIGIVLSVLAGKIKMMDNIFSWISLPCEAICPVTLLVAVYFNLLIVFPSSVLRIIFISLVFTIAFAGYMPARYNRSYSIGKNIIYNGLGLICAIFKWSFVLRFIGYTDLLGAANTIRSYSYRASWLWIPFFAAFVIVLVIEAVKRIVKQFMK